jgi:hypothetical protein
VDSEHCLEVHVGEPVDHADQEGEGGPRGPPVHRLPRVAGLGAGAEAPVPVHQLVHERLGGEEGAVGGEEGLLVPGFAMKNPPKKPTNVFLDFFKF